MIIENCAEIEIISIIDMACTKKTNKRTVRQQNQIIDSIIHRSIAFN